MFMTLLGLALADDAADYAYNPIGKRDPFRGVLSHPKRPEPDLEGWRLTATALSSEGGYVLLEAQGDTSVLRPGDYVPGTWARVRRIESDGVVIEEEYLDGVGELVLLSYRLELPEPWSR